jgi:PAS domain S-box-containing protein
MTTASNPTPTETTPSPCPASRRLKVDLGLFARTVVLGVLELHGDRRIGSSEMSLTTNGGVREPKVDHVCDDEGMAENRFVGASTIDGRTSIAPGSVFGGGGSEVLGQMFRSLADHSQEFIGLCDLEFKPFYLNEAGLRLVGLDSLEEACALKVRDFFFPEDQRYIVEEFLPKVLREGQGKVEIRFRHFKTGAALWMMYHVFQVREAQGRVSGYATLSQDVTERKRAEENLRADLEAMTRLQRLGGLFVREGNLEVVLGEIVEAGMATCGADFGNIQLLNADGTGLRVAAQRGFPQWWVDYWENVPAGRGTCGTALARGERVIVEDVEKSPIFAGTPELAVQLKAGVRASQSTPLVSRSGKVLGMFSTHYRMARRPDERESRLLDLLAREAADIIERSQIEGALRESEERLQQAIRVAGLGTFDHEHRADVIEYSPLMRELMGFGAEEEITLPALTERVFAEDREAFVAAVKRAHDPAGDGLFESDFRVADRKGRVRWVSARSRTFFGGEGTQRQPVRTAGAALDVTARKQAQAELERLVAERTAKLHELVGELEHFSYSITHDLKSPLRAMRGFAEMAGVMCDGSEAGRAKEFLERISTAAERMDRLIADALNYSRTVRQELPLEEVDAEALLRGMLDSYPDLRPEKARIQVEGRLPVVLANQAGLTQVFSNLLGNAVKFVKPGERPHIRVRASQVLKHSQHGERVRIWVQDKGIGISKDMLPRVFDMFTRGSKDYEGTGIGLALVRKVAQRMGGKVGVESEEGQGSRFWIELSCGKAKAGGAQTAVPTGAEAGEGTVLYVEDEESDATFMERAFKGKGLERKLRWVGSGRVAIDYLSGSGKFGDREKYPVPALVLLDLNLPQVSGFGVLEWMRNSPNYVRTPVVMFSSSTREDDRVKAKALGADEFVAKPSSGLKFGEVVEWLRERWLGVARVR